MATGLKRDHIVILRMDGDDLLEFLNSTSFEADMNSIFSEIDVAAAAVDDDGGGSIHGCITHALQQLTVDQGMPPLFDSWVVSNILEPALESGVKIDAEAPITHEILLDEFKKVAERLAQLLKEHPVIVAHTEQTFDGTGIRRLLSNTFEFNKILQRGIEDLPKDQNGEVSKEHLRVALDLVGPSAGLPPLGSIEQMDNMLMEAIQRIEPDERQMMKEEELKKLVAEILENIMLQLEANPISISSNSVVHEPISSSSSSDTMVTTSSSTS